MPDAPEGTSIAERHRFELTVGSFAPGELEVVSFQGREGISTLYSFDVVALAPADHVGLEEQLLGQPATLTLEAPGGGRRSITGIVSEARPEGSGPVLEAAGVRLRIVPRMWLLRRTKNSRIFQDKTAPEIVTQVLAQLRIPCESRLERPQRPKPYCVQYQETDFDFVRRVLAEEGLFFFFAQALPGAIDASDVVVLCDHAGYPAAGDIGDGRPPPVLVLRSGDGLSATRDSIRSFVPRRRVRSSAVVLKDYDFQRPMLDLLAEATTRSADKAEGERLEVYEPWSDYDEPEIRDERAQRRLDSLRRRALVAQGDSALSTLAAGHSFTLEGHAEDAYNGSYALVRVEHRGQVPERIRAGGAEGKDVYRNTFECAPADRPYRPRTPRRTPRQILETAIVVGPEGEEIHTDRLGRIKVHFHWDRLGLRNEHASCWVRVSQAWAGPSWGVQFIPRVGMEVLVSFIGGDPDRPVVTGCLYNPLNPPSHDLPQNATRSGVRTQSTPGADGHNELSFEDRRGKEMVYLHAERDLTEVVKNDHSITVGRFDPEDPSGDQRVRVARDQITEIGANRVVTVHGQEERTVIGGRTDTVQEGATFHVAGPRTDVCDASSSHRTAQNHALSIGGDGSFRVEGNASHVTGGDREERVFGRSTTRVGGYMTCSVAGDYGLNATQGVSISSVQGIRLVCGESSIDVGPKEILITSPTVTIAATSVASMIAEGVSLHLEKKKAVLASKDKVEIHGKDSEVSLDADGVVTAAKKEVHLFSKGASVILDGDASMDGGQVKLNCGGSHADPEEKDPDELEVSWVDIEFTRKTPKAGDPTQLEDRGVAGARYVVEAANGRIYRGTLDGEGKARVAVPPGAAEVSFPDEDAGRVKAQ